MRKHPELTRATRGIIRVIRNSREAAKHASRNSRQSKDEQPPEAGESRYYPIPEEVDFDLVNLAARGDVEALMSKSNIEMSFSDYLKSGRGPYDRSAEEVSPEDGEFDFDALKEFEASFSEPQTRAPISVALERLRAVANEIRAVEGLIGEVYERAACELPSAIADEIPFMSEDGLQDFDVVNELRRAIWQFSQAVNKPALDRAITAVQLAELASDFRE